MTLPKTSLWDHHPQQHCIRDTDPLYPTLLREIPNRPKVLYALGDIALLASPQLAIVGTRKPTPAGYTNAKHFSYHLAKLGLTITSGLALGIDGASHAAALQANGKTIAVLGSGLNHIYPARHSALAQKIAEHGLLLSEFPPDTPPLARHFPQRNRIISGLSYATLVIEATAKSGSLITAHFAADQGREVFAIPGAISNPQARGCHVLIREGARLVETVKDVVEELRPLLQLSLPFPIDTPTEAMPKLVTGVDKKVSFVLKYIGFEPTSLDWICEQSGLPAYEVSAILTQLEMHGEVESSLFGFSRIC
jgi:DNA processing protein